jgi:hypothetical protein
MERDHHAADSNTAAVTIAAYIRRLHLERLEAEAAGLGGCAEYMTDLEDEIEACRREFVLAAATEIALLRADMAAPLRG